MTETSRTRASNSLPSSSISAAVAPRPAYMPKLIRLSRPGGSYVRVAKAMPGSFCTFATVPSIGGELTLARLPSERAERGDETGRPPGGHDRDGRRLVPDAAAVEHHVTHELDEIRQRQHVRDRLEKGGKRLRREERTGDERDRKVNRIHDRGRALRAPHEAGEADSQGGEGGRPEQQRDGE